RGPEQDRTGLALHDHGGAEGDPIRAAARWQDDRRGEQGSIFKRLEGQRRQAGSGAPAGRPYQPGERMTEPGQNWVGEGRHAIGSPLKAVRKTAETATNL